MTQTTTAARAKEAVSPAAGAKEPGGVGVAAAVRPELARSSEGEGQNYMGTVFATTTTTARAAGGPPKDPGAITATGASMPMCAILKPVLATIAWLPTPALATTEDCQDMVRVRHLFTSAQIPVLL
jgi:hypothetical protein